MKSKVKARRSVINKIFTSGQASKVTGLPYHTVNYWAKTGLLVPKNPAKGSSTCRGYSFSDLVSMRVAARLKAAGVGTLGLKNVVDYLTKHGYETAKKGHLLIANNGEVEVVEKSKLISALGSPGRVFSVFAIGNEVAELTKEAGVIEPPARGKAKLVAG